MAASSQAAAIAIVHYIHDHGWPEHPDRFWQAATKDGIEQRTIVLAVERNTKELEPMIHDGNEL